MLSSSNLASAPSYGDFPFPLLPPLHLNALSFRAAYAVQTSDTMSSEKPQEVGSYPAAEGVDDAGTFVGSNSPNGGSKRGSQSEKSPEQHDGSNPAEVTADAIAKEEDETEYPKGLRL